MAHTTDAIVITCIDFRFQRFIDTWLKHIVKDYVFDRVALAGGIFDLYSILKQVEISNRLHHIKKVILMNHEECGAYGAESTYERHKNDLLSAKALIEKLHGHLNVECYYIYLDGYVESIVPETEQKHEPHTPLKIQKHK